MHRNHENWICAVDARRGRLLRCSKTPAGRCHVDEVDSIECDVPEAERGRPSPRVGRNGRAFSPEGNDHEERLHRFAKDVTDWLVEQARDRRLEHVTVFAPPRLLGELRKTRPSQLNGLWREQEADVAHLDAGELAKHPIVRQLVGVGA